MQKLNYSTLATFLQSAFLIAMVIALQSCQSGPTKPVSNIATTPIPIREDVEADLLALLFTAEIVAPQQDYLNISAELKSFRASIPPALSFLNDIAYMPPYVANKIKISMDSVGRRLIRNGEYNAWDFINADFGLKFVDTFIIAKWGQYDEYMSVTLGSAHRFNPYKVSAKYESLEGVEFAQTIGTAGDSPSLYYGVFDSQQFFLVRDGWGDCPSGCIDVRYYLFRKTNDQYAFEKLWPPISGFPEEVPQWLIDSKRGILLNYETTDLNGVPWELRRIPGPP